MIKPYEEYPELANENGIIYEHIDYIPNKNCRNFQSCGETCVKCGGCGRIFRHDVLIKEVK